MTYTVSEVWSKDGEAISVCFTTKTPLVFSEAGVALQKMGWKFKKREWHPQVSKQEIIEKSLEAIAERQRLIRERS